MNIEKLGSLNRKFNLVLAQGVLHHICDHYSFIKQLHRLTTDLMIIGTMLNARMHLTMDLGDEESNNLRHSPFSTLALVPSLPALLRFLKEVGFKEVYSIPFPARIRNAVGSGVDSFGYRRGHRIMLAAAS